ncbi:hypothetical protein [Pseudomonas granadensis]|uniref:hypothetical protein n=1 Tax=Pseudomonas granadensis TaxID=1421430 RepID=UPI000879A4A2|nr:hypothetical protein [Pseudomonas granadensis]SDT49036.1 hypothetical protein SAMN05216579_4066 [Pseudomonas granadensis]
MDFLRLLAFVAVWGFMWRWVVKNRGSWNLFFGNMVGLAGGLIVGLVVLSISLSLFPMAHEPKTQAVEETAAQTVDPAAVMPEAEPATVTVKEPAPAPALTPAPTPVPMPAPTPVTSNLPTYVASTPQNEPSPPESPLMPFYSQRMATTTISEKKLEDVVGANVVTLRRMMGTQPDADKSVLAAVMCVPFVQRAMRFPAAAMITPRAKTDSRLFKDQTYTITNTVTARNMLGDDVLYQFDCSIKQLPADAAGYSDWQLLDLKLKKADS